MSKIMHKFRLDKVIFKQVKSRFIDFPTPKKISYFWNLGFSLVVFLLIQVVRGLLLAMCYIGDVDRAFRCVDLIVRDVNYGWVVRKFHSNGASFFFLSMYIHIVRGLYYFSFFYIKLWITGIIIFILSMAIGFFGYVLPWGQMSFWAATVITKLFSIIPIIGQKVVLFLWGGFAVSLPTLTRFFALHFVIPFILLAIVFLHIIFLHEQGSNNPLGVFNHQDKVPFTPYFIYKDLYSQCIILIIYLFIVFYYPYKIINAVNFIESKPLVTPEHIEPEWYLLAPYVILRSVPKKVGGVIMLLMFFVVLIFLPLYVTSNIRCLQYQKKIQYLFFFWCLKFLFLTWCGTVPPEFPFFELRQLRCGFFFFYFIFLGLIRFFYE